MRATTLACAIAGLGLIQIGVAGAAEPLRIPATALAVPWDAGLDLGGSPANPSLDTGSPFGAASGPHLTLSSPRLELPGGTIGQQFRVDNYKRDGVSLTTAEMGSRYFTDIAPGLELGVGPGIGYTRSDTDVGNGSDLWAVQVGADLHYRQGSLLMGLDTRYRWTEDQAQGAGGVVPDSWLTRLKLGVSF